ncbi:MAG: hypothetical protein FWF76_04020 [Oscillospiraceae bacterium]|nr:hypothetical protein [Oscillospiraceae bacterium]
MNGRKNWLIPTVIAAATIITAAVFMLYKIAQASANQKKWEDYDDYGWS